MEEEGEEEEEEGSSKSYPSSSAATAADIGVNKDEDEESEGSKGMVVEENSNETEDYDDDIPRTTYAPDNPPTEPPTPYDDSGRIFVDCLILAMQIAKLNDTIASLEAWAVAVEDEIRIERLSLDEALEAEERLAVKYAYAARRCVELKGHLIDEVDKATRAASKNEGERSRAELKRLRDEHENCRRRRPRGCVGCESRCGA